MSLVRRLLLLWLLCFWLGGFTFYAAVVVPIGTEVLGSPLEQGWITRQVTIWLNVACAAALAPWAWDIAANPTPQPVVQRTRWLLWLVLVLLLIALVVLHPRLDSLLDVSAQRVLDRDRFRPLHRAYLWISTVQWGVALVLSALTLGTWRVTDRRG